MRRRRIICTFRHVGMPVSLSSRILNTGGEWRYRTTHAASWFWLGKIVPGSSGVFHF